MIRSETAALQPLCLLIHWLSATAAAMMSAVHPCHPNLHPSPRRLTGQPKVSAMMGDMLHRPPAMLPQPLDAHGHAEGIEHGNPLATSKPLPMRLGVRLVAGVSTPRHIPDIVGLPVEIGIPERQRPTHPDSHAALVIEKAQDTVEPVRIVNSHVVVEHDQDFGICVIQQILVRLTLGSST